MDQGPRCEAQSPTGYGRFDALGNEAYSPVGDHPHSLQGAVR